MKINDDLLEGNNVTHEKSPNHGKNFVAGMPDTIVIHYTAGSFLESSVKHLCKPEAKASAHLVIGRKGEIVQIVPFDTVAWHAGRSTHNSRKGLNKYSIGIELDNAGRLEKNGDHFISWFGRKYNQRDVVRGIQRNETKPAYWHCYTEDQINAVHEVCSVLVEHYNVKYILGHEEIAPLRKTDPGPGFPLDILRDRVLVRDRAVDDQETGSEKESSLDITGIVDASSLNIRCKPLSSSSTVSNPLEKGTIVKILQKQNNWYEVEVNIKGWVSKKYVRTRSQF